jgi:hypothetical protein
MDLSREAIIDYISNIDNFEEIFELVNIINSYDGSMPYIEYFYNDEEFFNIFFGINTMDAVRAVCFGNYNYSNEFVKFNAYNNLESANKYEVFNDYELYKEDIADKIIELYNACDVFLDLPEELYLN